MAGGVPTGKPRSRLHAAMKTYVCRHCNHRVQRASAPLKCESCQRQGIGVFRVEDPAQASSGVLPGAPPPPPVRPQVKPPDPARPAAPPVEARSTVESSSSEPPAVSEAPSVETSEALTVPAPSLERAWSDASATAADFAGASVESRPVAPARREEAFRQPPGAPAPAPAAGEIVWRHPAAPRRGAAPLRSCPAVADGRRIYVCQQDKLVALAEQEDSAQVLWEYATGGYIPGSPVLGPDGIIRLHSTDGQLHFVSPEGQAARKPVPVGEPLGWATPVVDRQGNAWICAYAGGLLKVSPDGGASSRPFFRSRTKFDSTGLICEGVLYVGGEDGFLHAIRLHGSRGEPAWDELAGQGKTDWFINAAPALADGAIVVAGRDERLHAFRTSGERLWSTPLPGQALASAVVSAAGQAALGVSLAEKEGRHRGGAVLAVDLAGGAIVWEHSCESPVESTPVLSADGTVYFGDNAGGVGAVRDGRLLWSCRAGAAVRSAGAISPCGRVLFGLEDGTLAAFSAERASLPAAGWPKWMGAAGNRCER